MWKAQAKVNEAILNPKGMSLQLGRLAHRIVLRAPISGSVEDGAEASNVGALEAHMTTVTVKVKKKSCPNSVFGQKERERAPPNYGTVELIHSSKNNVCEDVVRSIYTHVQDGATRGKHIIAC